MGAKVAKDDLYGNPSTAYFSMQSFGEFKKNDVASTIKARNSKGFTDLIVYVGGGSMAEEFNTKVLDCRNDTVKEELAPTLQAKPNGGYSLNYIAPIATVFKSKYRIRRLLPKECFRLQGLDGNWGDLPTIDGMSDEECKFWERVREEYAGINGKQYKPKRRQSLIKWYNRLESDSAKYKMAGNGIAKNCVDFIMNNISLCERTGMP
jgi:DNA (cytosine-5)-methyltransferase 1